MEMNKGKHKQNEDRLAIQIRILIANTSIHNAMKEQSKQALHFVLYACCLL